MKKFLVQKANRFTFPATCILTLLIVPSTARAAEFIPMGIPKDQTQTLAYGVSDDGMVVALADYLWTQKSGVRAISPIPPGYETFTFAESPLSGDGSVVVGILAKRFPDNWFRYDLAAYDLADGWRILDTSLDVSLEGKREVYGVSYDGSVIVGDVGRYDLEATIWTASGDAIGLGWLPGHEESRARGVSADGSVVVGISSGEPHSDSNTPSAFNNDVPFVWSQTTGMIDLGVEGEAYEISGDGSVAGGTALVSSSTDPEAFIRTAEEGVVGLGWLPGSELLERYWGTWGTKLSRVHATSGDGSVVIGMSGSPFYSSPSGKAFIWTEQSGMKDLQQLLIDDYGLGADLAGWNLWAPLDISANGQFIAGAGINPDGAVEGWLVRLDAPIPEPSTGVLVLASALLVSLIRQHRD